MAWSWEETGEGVHTGTRGMPAPATSPGTPCAILSPQLQGTPGPERATAWADPGLQEAREGRLPSALDKVPTCLDRRGEKKTGRKEEKGGVSLSPGVGSKRDNRCILGGVP